MFFWHRQKTDRIEGDRIDLVYHRTYPADPVSGEAESVLYWIVLHGMQDHIGECDLRIGMNEELFYAGNIGYRIYPHERGHGYAGDAAKILMKLASEEYGMKELLITCSPDNPASRRTLEKLGGELLDTVRVPESHWLFQRGEYTKLVYRFVL